MLRSCGFFLLVAKRATEADESDEGVIQEELSHDEERHYDVERKVKFPIELSNDAIEDRESHAEFVWVYLSIGY